MSGPGGDLGAHVRRSQREGHLVVQPRMGFGEPERMRAGLLATRSAARRTVGTLTVDSYTRTGDLDAARRAVELGEALNGYPIATHPTSVTEAVLEGLVAPDFPVQVRHGSPDPGDVVTALLRAGLRATEGGPVSYALPYGRIPLRRTLAAWDAACGRLTAGTDGRAHMETFGGCMLGQLCPPSLLVAVSVLEALYFRSRGLRSISLSYAQQTHPEQDDAAVRVLRRLAGELLADVDWHVVVYTYMGLYPRTHAGATRLNEDGARLAKRAGAGRLIVKTVAESARIPTIEDNVAALAAASAAAASVARVPGWNDEAETLYKESSVLVGAVLDADDDVGRALTLAFERGLLDVPYCLHADNAGVTRSHIDATGRLRWTDVGGMPLPRVVGAPADHTMTSRELLDSISFVRRRLDGR